MSEVTKNIVSDDYIMPFGKYQGEKIGNVKAAYLLWCIQQKWIAYHPKVKQYILNEEDTLLEEYESQHGYKWGHKRS